MAHHNEQCEFHERQRVQEQGGLLQVSVLQEDVPERLGCLDFLLLDHTVTNTDDGFLHVLGEIDSPHQKVHIVLFQVERVIGDPEVVE